MKMNIYKSNYIVILGCSKISYAIDYAITQYTNKKVIIVTTSDVYNKNKLVVIASPRGVLGQLTAISKGTDISLEELYKIMVNGNIHLAYMNCNDVNLCQLINDCSFVISCCRNGLNTFYVDKFNDMNIESEKTIVSLDNDENIYKQALLKNTNKKIIYCKGIVHNVVTSIENVDGNTICNTSGFAQLILPNTIPQDAFNSSIYMPIFKHSQIKICSHQELELVVYLKRISINAVHSLICAYILYEHRNTTDLNTLLDKPINSLLTYDKAYEIALNITRNCKSFYLARYSDKQIAKFDFSTVDFVEYLFQNQQEYVGRGFPVNCIENCKKHIEDIEFCIEAFKHTNEEDYKLFCDVLTFINSII